MSQPAKSLDPGHPPFACSVPRFACLPLVVRKKAASPLPGVWVPVTRISLPGFPFGRPGCRDPAAVWPLSRALDTRRTPGPPSKCTGLSSFAAPHSSRKCRARPLSAHDRLRWLFGDHAGCDSPLLSCQGISLSSRQASHPSFIQNLHLPFGLCNGAAAFLTLELPMDVHDSDELISLQKTLCAMRWIALMKCDQAVAVTIAANMAFVDH